MPVMSVVYTIQMPKKTLFRFLRLNYDKGRRFTSAYMVT